MVRLNCFCDEFIAAFDAK